MCTLMRIFCAEIFQEVLAWKVIKTNSVAGSFALATASIFPVNPETQPVILQNVTKRPVKYDKQSYC